MSSLCTLRRALWAGGTSWVLGASGCQGEGAPSPQPPASEDAPSLLSPSEHLVRISVSLRGLRPSEDELAEVEADPSAIGEIVDRYLASDRFGDIVRDMHAELLLTRTDADTQLPSLGRVQQWDTSDIYEATSEEPLKLVEYIVTHDRPYTEIVTADYMLANEVLADIYGLQLPSDEPGWQITRWVDGRPHAGLLSSSQVFRRHVSAGSNFHRLRANFLSEAFLCQSFAARDVAVEGGIDLTDEGQVASAVRDNPNCVACHQALDPLAALLWGYKRQIDPRAVESAEALGCSLPPGTEEPFGGFGESEASDYCYPLVMYTPSNEGMWETFDLRPPGYYGQPVDDLSDLGQQIAADPRFAQCATRRFYGWMTQSDPADAPLPLVNELQAGFVDSGFDAKALVRRIVLSDAFRAREPAAEGDAGLLTLRPEAYSDIIEQLTGFRWVARPDKPGCEPNCWVTVDLANSDAYGFRSLEGGIDGFQVLKPTHTATPTRVMVMSRFASEAAGYVVESDFARAPASRTLLSGVQPETTDEATVRAQIEALHHLVLGAAATTPEDIDEGWALFSDALDRTGDPLYAWKVVISMLLQDPRLLYY